MNNTLAIRERIKTLCRENNFAVPDLESFTANSTIEDIEQLCHQIGVSLADFFVNDIFRNK